MNTIVINVGEAGTDLEGLVNRLSVNGDSALLMHDGVVLAEIAPFPRSAPKWDTAGSRHARERESCGAPENPGPRVVRCPVTGHSVVAARPGERKITSEEIYELLRGSVP